jgi:hypothetical protein
MSTDLFDQLAESPVPPPPPGFDGVVHQRLNRALAVGHVLDFAVRAIPFACAEFVRAIGGFVVFTVTGSFPKHKEQQHNEPREDTPDIEAH